MKNTLKNNPSNISSSQIITPLFNGNLYGDISIPVFKNDLSYSKYIILFLYARVPTTYIINVMMHKSHKVISSKSSLIFISSLVVKHPSFSINLSLSIALI